MQEQWSCLRLTKHLFVKQIDWRTLSVAYQWGVCDSRLFDYLYFRYWRVPPSTWNHSNYGCQRCQLWSFSSSKVIEEGREAQNILFLRWQYASGYHTPYMYISLLNPYIFYTKARPRLQANISTIVGLLPLYLSHGIAAVEGMRATDNQFTKLKH